jgi:acetate kinase
VANSIAVINAGSSSIKFAIHAATSDADRSLGGQIEGIGLAPRLEIRDADGNVIKTDAWPAPNFDHQAAAREILAVVPPLIPGTAIIGVGHRVVHGGMHHDRPVRVTPDVLVDLSNLEPLAPLHQPHNLAPIRAIREAAPQMPQVACFDTAFHCGQPELAQAFALPRRFAAEGVRRYGFHGLSYEYLATRLPELSPELAEARVVIAHLGNGASMCAVKNGRSVASTMGFTAVDGLMMGTRCGALDPGVILYMIREHGMDAAAIESLIYRQSGLLGFSGISSDMRALRASAEPGAREAIALFVYRIVRELGSLVAALGGIDALVFSGGIGEHDAMTRAEVVEGSRWLGAVLDPERNARGNDRISADGSAVSVWAIATDEERLIARHTLALVA